MTLTKDTVASKLVVGFVAAAMLFSLSFAPAKAATSEELQAQIARESNYDIPDVNGYESNLRLAEKRFRQLEELVPQAEQMFEQFEQLVLIGGELEEIALLLHPFHRRAGLGGEPHLVLVNVRFVLGVVGLVAHRIPAGVFIEIDVAVLLHALPERVLQAHDENGGANDRPQ